MARKVRVDLEANVSGYIPPIDRAAAATERLDDKVEALDNDLDKIPADAAKAAAAAKALGTDLDTTGDKLKAIGDKSTALAILDRKIANSRSEVRKLSDEFIRTGDIDVFQKLGEASGKSQALTVARKKLVTEMKEGAQEAGTTSARTFSSAWQGSILATFQALPPEAKAALVTTLVGVAAIAAPAILAAVAGAILAGVGAAGLGGAIAIAAQDPKIKAAFSTLGKDIFANLKDAVSPIRDELLTLPTLLGAGFNRISPQLRSMFSSLAVNLQPLAAGLVAMIERMLPGLARAVDAAGPVLRMIAAEMPRLGDAVSRFFSSIADGGPGAALAFQALLRVLGDTLINLGLLFEYSSKAFLAIAKLGEGIAHYFGASGSLPVDSYAHALGNATTATEDLAAGTAEAQAKLQALQGQINATTISTDTLAASMVGKAFNSMMSLDQASLSWHSSLLAVKDAIDSNGRSLDINTTKGISNRQAILGAVTANMQQYQAFVAAGGSAVDAARNYDTNTAALERQLRKAGYTAEQIQGLIGKYKNVPGEVNTAIALKGLERAIDDLSRLIAKINGIHDKTINVDVYTNYRTMGQSRNPPLEKGGIRRAQTGMFIPPSDPGTVLVGEPQTGGEWLIPAQGIDTRRAAMLGRAALGSYGLDVVPRGGGRGSGGTNVYMTINAGLGTDGYALGQQIASALRPFVASAGGGNVQAALGVRGK